MYFKYASKLTWPYIVQCAKHKYFVDLENLPVDPLILYEIYNCSFVELFFYFVNYII
jgi:hypothetical protein